jgi:hypothetical protein
VFITSSLSSPVPTVSTTYGFGEEDAHQNLGSLGKIRSFILVASSEKDGVLTRSYWVEFDSAKLTMKIVIDKSGLISTLGFQ